MTEVTRQIKDRPQTPCRMLDRACGLNTALPMTSVRELNIWRAAWRWCSDAAALSWCSHSSRPGHSLFGTVSLQTHAGRRESSLQDTICTLLSVSLLLSCYCCTYASCGLYMQQKDRVQGALLGHNISVSKLVSLIRAGMQERGSIGCISPTSSPLGNMSQCIITSTWLYISGLHV